MALSVRCPLGHPYTSADYYMNWPEGAPHCPICFEEWKFQKRLREYGDKAFPYSASSGISSTETYPLWQRKKK